jgi:ribose/xylose/arabinose/galactoside ABC-type transport system permease subunit
MSLSNVPDYTQQVIRGVVIVIAVVLRRILDGGKNA